MVRPAERTDAQVVRDVLDGDLDAFRLLVRRFGDVMYRHAQRMVSDPDDAADLVQDALVSGFRRLEHCRDRDRVGAWLFRILANRCKDHLRSSRRRPSVPVDVVQHIATDAPEPDALAGRSEAWARVRGALDCLTPDQREAFVLKHVEGRSYEEMAAVIDTSVASLKMRVRRARESLQPLLEEYR